MGIDVPRVPGIVPRPTPEALAAARTGRRIVRPKAIDLSKVPLDRSLTLPVIEGTTPRPMPTTGKPAAGIAGAIAAGRVRALAKPAIEKLGQSPGEPDLDGVFAPATVPKDAPR
jgi:hypothetical protein